MLVGPLVALAPWRGIDSDKLAAILLLAGVVVTGYALVRLAIGPSAGEERFGNRIGGGYNRLEGELRPLGGVGDAHALSSLMAPFLPFAFALALGRRG